MRLEAQGTDASRVERVVPGRMATNDSPKRSMMGGLQNGAGNKRDECEGWVVASSHI